MFREMRRKKQQIPDNEAIAILENGKVGILAVNGDNGYPYTVPLNYMFYNGKIYFHGASEGHKFDSIKNNPKVSFCVISQDKIIPEKYTTAYESVVVFGNAKLWMIKRKSKKLFMTLQRNFIQQTQKKTECSTLILTLKQWLWLRLHRNILPVKRDLNFTRKESSNFII